MVCSKRTQKEKPEATEFLRGILAHFEDLQKALPKQKYGGAVDCLCELDTKELALVEVQVLPQDYWDRRALAYVAAFYANQLTRGQHWKTIKKVIGVNIMGGGKGDKAHWPTKPEEYRRHYKFQDQLQPTNYIDGIELIQYSVMNTPQGVSDMAQRDWLVFFKKGHAMSEAEVANQIHTPAVLEAFERIKLQDLPQEVMVDYEVQDKEFDRFSNILATAATKAEKEKQDAVAAAEAKAEKEKQDAVAAAEAKAEKGKQDAVAAAEAKAEKGKQDAVAAAEAKAEKEKQDAVAAAVKKAEQEKQDVVAALEQKLAEAQKLAAAHVEAAPVAAQSKQEEVVVDKKAE